MIISFNITVICLFEPNYFITAPAIRVADIHIDTRGQTHRHTKGFENIVNGQRDLQIVFCLNR